MISSRIDHFRGFAGYWEVPAGEKTAVKGRWVKGPGADFFDVVKRELGELPIIAEDLGEITPDVIELRDRFNLPGMKVLQFAFSTDASDKFLPHNFRPTFVVYSGTHDNDTTRGWYEGSATDQERDHFRRYSRTDGSDAAWTLIDSAFRSVAVIAIVPLQDMLNLGTERAHESARSRRRQLDVALPRRTTDAFPASASPGGDDDLWPRPGDL